MSSSLFYQNSEHIPSFKTPTRLYFTTKDLYDYHPLTIPLLGPSIHPDCPHRRTVTRTVMPDCDTGQWPVIWSADILKSTNWNDGVTIGILESVTRSKSMTFSFSQNLISKCTTGFKQDRGIPQPRSNKFKNAASIQLNMIHLFDIWPLSPKMSPFCRHHSCLAVSGYKDSVWCINCI